MSCQLSIIIKSQLKKLYVQKEIMMQQENANNHKKSCTVICTNTKNKTSV